MPGHFLPRKSGPHRIACTALYRALLTQCPRIPLPADLPPRGPINPLTHLIRKKFKQNIYHTSPRIVVNALKNGYAAGELLQAAGDGNKVALGQVHALLQTHTAQALHAKAVTPKPRVKSRVPRPVPYPGAPKLLDILPRPKEQLGGTGRRIVPRLGFANNGMIPFLHTKKPQSVYLSRVIRQKVRTNVQRTALQEKLEEEIEVGLVEGMWEQHVLDQLEREGKEWDDGDWGTDVEAWSRVPREVLYWAKGLQIEEKHRLARAYERMVGILGEEERLCELERKERRHEKREAKWVVKKERWASEERKKEWKEMVEENTKLESGGGV